MIHIFSHSYVPFQTASANLTRIYVASSNQNTHVVYGNTFKKKGNQSDVNSSYIPLPNFRIFHWLHWRLQWLLLPYYLIWVFFYFLGIDRKDSVVLVYPNWVLFISAYLSAIIFGKKYSIWMHDLWEENMRYRFDRLFARVEKYVFGRAENILVCTPRMAAHYKLKYGIKGIIIEHPTWGQRFPRDPQKRSSKDLVYIGNLSREMNFSAIYEIVHFMRDNLNGWRFIFYPSYTHDLSAWGIDLPNVEQRICSSHELYSVMDAGRFLLAPLSFDKEYTEEISTVFSNKLLWYLAMDVPIISYAPSYSYHDSEVCAKGYAIRINSENRDERLDYLKRALQAEAPKGVVIAAKKEWSRRHIDSIKYKFNEIL